MNQARKTELRALGIVDVGKVVAETFPEIYWQVWHNPDGTVEGGIDGWHYKLGVYRFGPGTANEVCSQMIATLQELGD